MREFFERLSMPEQVSEWAPQVDWLNSFITWAAIFCTISLSALMLYFMLRYRKKGVAQKTSYITHNLPLEIVWTVFPTLVVIFVFYYGTVYYGRMRTPPTDALEINVEGYQWGWNFEYPGGKKSATELVVPLGKPVKLIMRSRDVNHSLFIPVLRIKEDMMAGVYHYMWFTATKEGEYPIFCAEFCGLNHSYMRATLKVVPGNVYEEYVKASSLPVGAGLLPLELGKKLFTERGCAACHSLDGSVILGPSLKAVNGRVSELADGTKVTVDDNYMKESMLNPAAKLVKGFQPVMPPFQGLLSDEEVQALIAFLKEQKG